MGRLWFSHSDFLVGYKYCNGIDSNRLEDDILVVHSRSADLKKLEEYRVLPKRLAKPRNRLMAVVSTIMSR